MEALEAAGGVSDGGKGGSGERRRDRTRAPESVKRSTGGGSWSAGGASSTTDDGPPNVRLAASPRAVVTARHFKVANECYEYICIVLFFAHSVSCFSLFSPGAPLLGP